MNQKTRNLSIYASLALVAASLAFYVLGAESLFAKKKVPKEHVPFLSQSAPVNPEFQQELKFMFATRRLTARQRTLLETEIGLAEERFNVPRSILWCTLFQESRFDSLKNAGRRWGARGIGQFTPHALREINRDTDFYHPGTGALLGDVMRPERLPLTFNLAQGTFRQKKKSRGRQTASVLVAGVSQPRSSYFNMTTAVAASAAYLNNRYIQIKEALDSQQIEYHPEIIWLLASAAYNKGARTVFSLLNHQRKSIGNDGLSEILQSPRLTYKLLSSQQALKAGLRTLWPARKLEHYTEELSRNMDAVFSCAVMENAL